MAQKFGGKFSPGAKTGHVEPESAFRGRQASRVSLTARLMYVLPIPLLISGILAIGRPLEMAAELAAFVGLLLAAWLLNDGIRAEAEYDARKVAKPPAIPRKLFAAILVAISVAIAASSGLLANQIVQPAVLGAIAGAAHLAAFGIDPMKRKGMAGHDDFQTERVAGAVEKAEGTVREMIDAAKRIGDRRLEGRVERMAQAARDVFRTVEEDPRDLSRARKFMTVYLAGARDATVKFADLYSRRRDPEARADYEDLLSDLEASFTAHREELLSDNKTDLDVEIEVLRERLQREGVRAEEEVGHG